MNLKRTIQGITFPLIGNHTAFFVFLIFFTSISHSAILNITGLTEKNKKRFLPELEPRLEYILKREASSWRADDAAFLLKRQLIRKGYSNAQVDWRLPGNNVIDLVVIPGQRFYFGEVTTIQKTVIPKGDIKEYFLQPLVDTEAVRIKQAPYIVEYVEKGVGNVKNYLKSLGYWTAKVEIVSEQAVNNRVNVALDVQTGNLLTMAPPSYEGVSSENVEIIANQLKKYIGIEATTQNVNLMRRAVIKHYEDNGFQFAEVEMVAEHSETEKHLKFIIQEGSQYTVGKVLVNGLEKTKKRRISRYFRKQKGENYDQSEIDRIVTRILKTGALRSLVVNPYPAEGASVVDLQIDVVEAKARTVRTYTGFGNFEGFILGAGFSNSNLLGDLRKFYTGAEFSGRGILGEVGINEPRVFNSPLDANARAFLVERFNEGFDVRKAGLEMSFNWNPIEPYLIQAYGSFEHGASSTSSLNSEELGPDDYFVTRFGLEQTLDQRNNRLVPTAGYHTRLLLEVGILNGDAATTFFHGELENSFRYNLSKNNQLSARLLVSILDAKDATELPIDVRLFSGGVNTQRAFAERELGPQSGSNDPLGGEAFWVGSLEYSRTISEPFKAITFFDAGNVFNRLGEFSFSNPSFAAGLGFRIDLPIGPVRLEYGRNLNRQSGDSSGAFHFSIGASF